MTEKKLVDKILDKWTKGKTTFEELVKIAIQKTREECEKDNVNLRRVSSLKSTTIETYRNTFKSMVKERNRIREDVKKLKLDKKKAILPVHEVLAYNQAIPHGVLLKCDDVREPCKADVEDKCSFKFKPKKKTERMSL